MTEEHYPHCLILGGGHAGGACAFALRKEGWTGDITLAGEETLPPYHRPPLSKAYLKEETGPEGLLIRPRAWYEQNRIHLALGGTATGIDRVNRKVYFLGGESLPYDHLVLATGSVNHRPDLPGVDLPGVFFLRNVADAEALRAAARSATRVVLVGGGYVALEVAASLRMMGKTVTLLHRGARVLSRVTSPEVSDFLENVHREEGVNLLTNVAVAAIEKAGAGLRVVTRDGASHDADLVVLGTGAVPNVALARDAGLDIDHAIVVDEANRTSDPSIFAIGDCTRQYHPLYGRHLHVESVQNANDQARTAAAVLTGKPTPPRPLPWFWSDQYNLKLQIAGLFGGYTHAVARGRIDRQRRFSVWYFRDQHLLAVDAINDPAAYVIGGKLIEARATVDPAQVADPAYDLKQLIKKNQGASS